MAPASPPTAIAELRRWLERVEAHGRTEQFRFPNPIQHAGNGIGKSHPFVRSFRPDLRTASAVAHSGGQGCIV
jgi:hypothetical protein